MTRPKVWHRNDPDCPPDAMYVGRAVTRIGLAGSPWGNPSQVTSDATVFDRLDSIRDYANWALDEISVGRVSLKDLRGKHLKCWCKPRLCHADVLLELANLPEKELQRLVEARKA